MDIDFMCIGFPKCGTTSLHDILSQHRDIYLPAIKETVFFQNDNIYKMGYDWYIKTYFSGYGNQKIVGEINPTLYMYVNRIKKTLKKDFKIIFIMRNPVEQLYSSFKMGKLFGLSFDKIKLNCWNDHQKSFDYYIKKNFFYDKNINKVKFIGTHNFAMADAGNYYKYIQTVLKFINPQNVKFIIFEDFIVSPRAICEDIFKFLNIEKDNSINFNIKSNEAKMVPINQTTIKIFKFINENEGAFMKFIRNPNDKNLNKYRNLRKIIYTNLSKEDLDNNKMSNKARNILQKYYKEDKEKLEEFLDRDLKEIWFK